MTKKILLLFCICFIGLQYTHSMHANNTFSQTVQNNLIYGAKEIIGFGLHGTFNHPKLVILGGGTLILIGTVLTFRELMKKIENLVGTVALVGLGALGLLTLAHQLDKKSGIKKGAHS